jgi:hypothetical protein
MMFVTKPNMRSRCYLRRTGVSLARSQGACLIENGPSRLEVERDGVVLASDEGCSMSARLSVYATNLVFTASVVAMRSLLGKYLYRNCQLTRIVALHAIIDSEV